MAAAAVAALGSRTLELTVLSGENLSINHKPLSENAYFVVWIDSINCCTTKLATDGVSNPSWNDKFLVDMPMHATFITFDVQCKTRTGVKRVGAARVPVSEFLGGIVPDGFLKFLSYRLRDRQGRRNGIINFSVRVHTPPECLSLMTKRAEGVAEAAVNETSVHGFQMPSPLMDQQSSKGAVAGVPISFLNSNWNCLGK